MVRLAALLAIDAAPSSYNASAELALASGASLDEIVGILIAVAPTIGLGRVVSAAPALGLALRYDVDAALERQPWKAAHERDYGWLSALMAEHYAGDDSNVMVLGAGILAAYDGISVEDFEAQADTFLRNTKHPTLGRGYLETAYQPMVE